jgi:hypothetical protein
LTQAHVSLQVIIPHALSWLQRVSNYALIS